MFSPLDVQRFKRVLVLLVGNQEIHFRNNVSVFSAKTVHAAKPAKRVVCQQRDVIFMTSSLEAGITNSTPQNSVIINSFKTTKNTLNSEKGHYHTMFA